MVMSLSLTMKIKEQYLHLCHERSAKPHQYILTALEKATVDDNKDEGEYCQLYRIDLSGNKLLGKKRLEDIDIDIFCSALLNADLVSSLDLRYNNFTNNGTKTLANLIEKTMSLKEINLMCSDIGLEGSQCIANALRINKSIKSLILNGNKICDKGGLAIVRALGVNITLSELDLGNCDLRSDSIIALITCLRNDRYLRAISLNRPIPYFAHEEIAVHLSYMLRNNDVLEELHLQMFGISDFDLKRICEGLKQNFTLNFLDLKCNKISQDGAFYFAKLLRNNNTLSTLDLGCNRIESPGAIYLAECLTKWNRSLTTLGVVSNQIKGAGFVALALSIEMNPIFTNIYIWGNNIDSDTCTIFGKLIYNQTLKLKNTDVKPYKVSGCTYLAHLSHGIHPFYYWKPIYGLDYIFKSDDAFGEEVVAANC